MFTTKLGRVVLTAFRPNLPQNNPSITPASKLDNGQSTSKAQRFCQILGVEAFYAEFRRASAVEEKKPALLHDRRAALYASILHVIPITASVTLLAFNLRGYYIGSELTGQHGEDNLKLLGLQFAAKLLELLVLASLSSILFMILRKQLFKHSLPFGAVTAGLEFTRISFLWSKEFFATCISTTGENGTFSSVGGKIILTSTIVTFTILGATIGPSAAVAAQPVLRNWPAGGTVFWLNSTSTDLWPIFFRQCDRIKSGLRI